MKKKQLLSGVMALLLSAHSVHAEAARQQKAPQKQLASPAKQRPVILFQKEHQYQAAALCMA